MYKTKNETLQSNELSCQNQTFLQGLLDVKLGYIIKKNLHEGVLCMVRNLKDLLKISFWNFTKPKGVQLTNSNISTKFENYFIYDIKYYFILSLTHG